MLFLYIKYKFNEVYYTLCYLIFNSSFTLVSCTEIAKSTAVFHFIFWADWLGNDEFSKKFSIDLSIVLFFRTRDMLLNSGNYGICKEHGCSFQL